MVSVPDKNDFHVSVVQYFLFLFKECFISMENVMLDCSSYSDFWFD